jgi:tRNA(Ile2)-agmatinylcytidine synthase
VQLHIGIDDTDSVKGGCTTYIAARLVEEFSRAGHRFIDYPNIIRLNPNIPYKTRGNAAVALRIAIPSESLSSVQEAVLHEIEQNSHLGQTDTDPAAVFLKGPPNNKIRDFSQRALWDILGSAEAIRILRSSQGSAAAYGSKLGLVGALAAVGQTLFSDHTFELVAYRIKLNCGTPRQIDENSVKRMDRLTTRKTFNNYDYENKRVLIAPHGPDPVLLGIRGETADIVKKAFSMLTIREPIERWVIFRTNHGTDAHFQHVPRKAPLKPNRPAVVRGTVAKSPWRIPGGHVFLALRQGADLWECAAFEPTGPFRGVAANLIVGDDVTAYGGAMKNLVTQSLAINLEKIQIHHLVDKIELSNPICPICHKHMKSAGRGQGFRCEKCSTISRNVTKVVVKKARSVLPGIYVPTLKAHRHLTKPLVRYGHEKKKWDQDPPSGTWHAP